MAKIEHEDIKVSLSTEELSLIETALDFTLSVRVATSWEDDAKMHRLLEELSGR